MTVVFGTGHRPEDINMDYGQVLHLIRRAIETHPREIKVAVCGMASGFDLAWGMEALNKGIEVWSVRPWAGHGPRMGEPGDRRRYDWIEKDATRHIITNDSLTYPGPYVIDPRNRWMVDNADEGIALWNGKESGGTYNCLQYASGVSKDVINIYPE